MNTPHSLQARLWQEVFLLSLAFLGLLSILFLPLLEKGSAVFSLSILAGTSGILLAMSFSLSSFAYYFNFLDSRVVYRKQLGLMGYFFALGYALLAASLYPERYIYSFPGNLLTMEVGVAVLAMAIFTVMACVSHVRAAQFLGGKLWKNILGLGYIAYALLVIRGIFLDASFWQAWFIEGTSTITPRMFLTVLGTLVLLFRASVPFHKKYSSNI